MENKVLGKGLSALISQKLDENNKDRAVSSLETSIIKNNRQQPRQNYNDSSLESLKASIAEKGILQPILVRAAGNGYEVIAGERRLRAARALGLPRVPVIIKNVTDQESFVLALIENIQREDLNAVDKALGYKRLIEEFKLTQESVAQSVGKDRTSITNGLRLLKLPQEIQQYIIEERISEGHARALLGLDSAKDQKAMADMAIAKNLSVRQVEAYVRKDTQTLANKIKKVNSKSRDIQILEEELSQRLGTRVFVEHRNNKGKVVIEYYSLDDLDRILGIIRT